MSDNLWYIYDYEPNVCDECGSMGHVAVWRKGDTDVFVTVCGYCDQEWREKQVLANGSK